MVNTMKEPVAKLAYLVLEVVEGDVPITRCKSEPHIVWLDSYTVCSEIADHVCER